MPISRAVLITLRAISPRFAISIFEHVARFLTLSVLTGLDQEEGLFEFYRAGIIYKYLHDLSSKFTFNLIE